MLEKAGASREAVRRALAGASRRGHVEVVRLLVEVGAERLEQIEHMGFLTALHNASNGGHPEVVRTLLEARASQGLMKEKTSDIRTHYALHLAAEHGHLEVVSR